MRALVQRVKEASVTVDGEVRSTINGGMLILLGVRNGDTQEGAAYLAQRCANLRVFADENGNMNLSLKDTGGSALVVSQFTLYADTRKGNRPGFSEAAPGAVAEPLYAEFIKCLAKELGEPKVCSGVFGAMMDVRLVNDGPVTVSVESK